MNELKQSLLAVLAIIRHETMISYIFFREISYILIWKKLEIRGRYDAKEVLNYLHVAIPKIFYLLNMETMTATIWQVGNLYAQQMHMGICQKKNQPKSTKLKMPFWGYASWCPSCSVMHCFTIKWGNFEVWETNLCN